MITAIIVNYRTASLARPLIQQLLAEPLIKEIIIVDNSGEALEELKDLSVKVISNPVNVGFGRAVNQGAKKATTPYLLVVNPDVRICPGAIQALLDTAERTKASLLGPRFYWDEKKIFRLPPATGHTLAWELFLKAASLSPYDAMLVSFYWLLRHERFWESQEPFYEPFLSGACLLIRQNDFRPFLFDERFFLYYEDTDLCLRAQKEKKLVLCVPQAEMIHFWNQSPEPPPSKAYFMEESKQKFLQKYYLNIQNILCFPLGGEIKTLFLKPKEALPNEKIFLEVSINPLFIPFAQANWYPDLSLDLPREIKLRLNPGKYFLRLRGEISGVIQQKELEFP